MHCVQGVFANIRNDISALFDIAKRQMMAKQSMSIFHEPIFILLMCGGLYIAITYLSIETSVLMMLAALFYRFVIAGKVFQQGYQVLAGQESFFWSLQGLIGEAKAAKEIAETSNDLDRTITLENSIMFDNVTFSYDKDIILHQQTFEIPALQMTGITGASGAGKTTVIDLICGLYTPNEGQITIDGKILNEIDILKWRSHIGYVPQEFVILNDTIFNNLTLGDPTLSEDEAIEALKKAEAWNFINNMPDGIHTNLGERGSRLSGGQRQRISIARALIRRPKLLILDEATAALDSKTEAEIFKTLKKLTKSMTIIAISHQDAMKTQADNIITL